MQIVQIQTSQHSNRFPFGIQEPSFVWLYLFVYL